MTIETTYSQAREQFKTLMDRAVDDREVVLVRRHSGGCRDDCRRRVAEPDGYHTSAALSKKCRTSSGRLGTYPFVFLVG